MATRLTAERVSSQSVPVVISGDDGTASPTTVDISVTLTWDNGAAVFVMTGSINGTEVQQRERWTPSADGKTITVHRSVVADGSEVSAVDLVFVKKS